MLVGMLFIALVGRHLLPERNVRQELVGEDKQVERWITDLTRRVAANQRTANVTE